MSQEGKTSTKSFTLENTHTCVHLRARTHTHTHTPHKIDLVRAHCSGVYVFKQTDRNRSPTDGTVSVQYKLVDTGTWFVQLSAEDSEQ